MSFTCNRATRSLTNVSAVPVPEILALQRHIVAARLLLPLVDRCHLVFVVEMTHHRRHLHLVSLLAVIAPLEADRQSSRARVASDPRMIGDKLLVQGLPKTGTSDLAEIHQTIPLVALLLLLVEEVRLARQSHLSHLKKTSSTAAGQVRHQRLAIITPTNVQTPNFNAQAGQGTERHAMPYP